MTVSLILSAIDCARSRDNPDTCGVCGKHFKECEEERVTRGDEEEPACAGARVRAALVEMRALYLREGLASMFSEEELKAITEAD